VCAQHENIGVVKAIRNPQDPAATLRYRPKGAYDAGPRIRYGAVRLVNRAVYPCRINRIFSHPIACMLGVSNHGEPSSNQVADFA
jgi:hypothetical protein